MPGSSNSQRNSSSRTTFSSGLAEIHDEVVRCRRCSRLVAYREAVAYEKRKEFESWDYWGKPVPGFGDHNASLLIVGLAPAAHGGNRTGRVFTGDRSGDFLYNVLYKTGFANKPVSVHSADGLVLNNAYITAAVKCAPPDNKPSPGETQNCSGYLASEIDALTHLAVILCLGQFAFKSVVNVMRKKYDLGRIHESFAHGRVIRLRPEAAKIICSYHPSPRNTQTGKLTENMLIAILRKAQKEIEDQPFARGATDLNKEKLP